MANTSTDPDLSKLAAYAGSYRQELFSRLYSSLDAANDLTLWTGIKNKTNLTKLVIRSGFKPGTGVFAPNPGDISYEPRVLEVQPWQRDLIITPSKYRNSFMADMRGKGENPTNKTIPFAAYTLGKVVEEVAASINDTAVYFGLGKDAFATFSAATTYNAGDLVKFTKVNGELGYFKANSTTTAGQTPVSNPELWDDYAAAAVMVGFGKIISDLVNLGAGHGGLDPVPTGVINSVSGAYAQQKKVFRALPDAIKNRGAILYQSITDFELLTDDFEDKVSKFTETDNGIVYLSGTGKKCEVRPVTWLNRSRRLIATPKTNMILATDEMSDMNTIATEEHVYTLDMAMSGVIGSQIQDPEAMRVSDQK